MAVGTLKNQDQWPCSNELSDLVMTTLSSGCLNFIERSIVLNNLAPLQLQLTLVQRRLGADYPR